MAVFIRGRDIGVSSRTCTSESPRAWVHAALALVGIAAFALNFAGLFTPDRHGY